MINEKESMITTKIEELSANAFPALSTTLLNGWVLRFSDGYAKRVNSVAPIYPCIGNPSENIKKCEAIYWGHGFDSVFKLTECPQGLLLDKLLEEQEYRYEAKTNILLKELSPEKELSSEKAFPPEKGLSSESSRKNDLSTALEDSSNVTIRHDFHEDWFHAFTSMNNVSAPNKEVLREILHRLIPTAHYASYSENGEILAVGLGVSEDGYIGMFDIFVHKDHRRKGFGTKIMDALMKSGAANGCTKTYLQVVDANENAKALYKKLGYEKVYSYWYRIKESNQGKDGEI